MLERKGCREKRVQRREKRTQREVDYIWEATAKWRAEVQKKLGVSYYETNEPPPTLDADAQPQAATGRREDRGVKGCAITEHQAEHAAIDGHAPLGCVHTARVISRASGLRPDRFFSV